MYGDIFGVITGAWGWVLLVPNGERQEMPLTIL